MNTSHHNTRLITGLAALLITGMALSGCIVDIPSAPTLDEPPGTVIAPTDGPAPTEPPPPTDIPEGETATVTWVVDGDTVDVLMDGETYRVRYIGIDTPERDEACYDEATQANIDLVKGKTVQMIKDVSETDQYGRLLRYLYAGDVFINAELVRQGWARSYRYYPDLGFADLFDALEDEARVNNRGCHPTGVFD